MSGGDACKLGIIIANIHLRNADAFLDDVGETMSIVIAQSICIRPRGDAIWAVK